MKPVASFSNADEFLTFRFGCYYQGDYTNVCLCGVWLPRQLCVRVCLAREASKHM